MTESTVVKEERGYRVRLVHDTDAVEPMDDGATPIIRALYNRAGDVTIEAFNEQAKPYATRLEELYYTEGSFTMALTRLRRIVGTVHYDAYGPNQGTDYKYIAFDTQEFREALELPTWLTGGESNTAAESLTEVQAWVEGDCWGWVVESRRAFTKTYDDGEVQHGEEWEQMQSCWGFYGEKYATEAAIEELNTVLAANKEG